MLCVEVLNFIVSFWNIGVLLFDAFKPHLKDNLWYSVLEARERRAVTKVREKAKWSEHTNACCWVFTGM